MLVADDQFMSP